MKLTEANIGELFTTDRKDVIKLIRIENVPNYFFKNIETGKEAGVTEGFLHTFKRLIPEPRKYERKQVEQPIIISDGNDTIEFNNSALTSGSSEIFTVKSPKHRRKAKAESQDLIATFHVDALNNTVFMGGEQATGSTLKAAVANLFIKLKLIDPTTDGMEVIKSIAANHPDSEGKRVLLAILGE
jgi:hypothetical protein